MSYNCFVQELKNSETSWYLLIRIVKIKIAKNLQLNFSTDFLRSFSSNQIRRVWEITFIRLVSSNAGKISYSCFVG